MDLLATVRKEGSRGGAGDFKWSDVQSSSRREHYLGHSLMAPVGRWQKGRDLNWYAKADEDGTDGEDPEAKAARERKEELRRVKEAEEDAMARALGLPVPDRTNPNLLALSDKKEVDRVLKDINGPAEDNNERGIGFGGNESTPVGSRVLSEQIEGNAEADGKQLQYALKEYKRRHTDRDRHRRRSTSRDNRNSRHSKRDRSRERPRHRHSSRERLRRHHHRRESSRSRSPAKSRPKEDGYRDRSNRSRSPYSRDDRRYEQDRRRK